MNITNAKQLIIDGKQAIRVDFDGEPVWQKPLPSGYTRLDYIETSNAQYIDTGFKPNQDTRAVVEFQYLSGTEVYGTRRNTTSGNFSMRAASTYWQPGYNNLTSSSSVAYDTKRWHVADQNKNVFTIDGVVAKTFEYATFTTGYSFILGGINSGEPYLANCRYRACSLYDNGKLIRELVPCINPEGRAGMYDILNDVFYGNAGTGEFIVGEL